MDTASYTDDNLYAAIEAYADAMGESYGLEPAGEDVADELIEAVVAPMPLGRGDSGAPSSHEEADEFTYGDRDIMGGEEEDMYPIPPLAAAPFSPRLSLPAPTAMSPGALHTRLLRDLQFPESSALMSALERLNLDLFSCMPANVDLYEDAKIFSQNPDDVIQEAEEKERNRPRTHTTAVDLNAHGSVELPRVPDRPEDLIQYVQGVQQFFISELRAREAAYAKLFMGYCRALVIYIKRSAAHETRGLRVVDRQAEINRRVRKAIVNNYYREAARLARIIYLHLYLSVCREAARRLSALQAKKKDLFVHLKYEWTGQRQFWCLFHAVMQQHGVAVLDGEPVSAKSVRILNHVRVELGMLPVRFGLLEMPGQKITEVPEFTPGAPRSTWYLGRKILDKLMAYSRKQEAGTPAATISVDHPYSRKTDAPNYGSTVERLLDDPDPETELPGDPYCPPCAGVVGV